MVNQYPFRLRVLKNLTTSLQGITKENGYNHNLAPDSEWPEGKVLRGRDIYGESDPLPMVSILEPPLPIDQLRSPLRSSSSTGEWDLLIQGFVDDDKINPTDPAHMLMADVKKCLIKERMRTLPQSAGSPNPFGMGRNIVEGVGRGNIITDIIIGPGVVRPAELGVSNKAYFWLTLTLKIAEDMDDPFV